VLEVPLGGGTSDALKRSGITIKFAFTAEPRGDVIANELQATEVDSTTSPGTEVAIKPQTLENTWNVLLQRMALFNGLVAGIAEVSVFSVSPLLLLSVA
jgi:hypothetical protein